MPRSSAVMLPTGRRLGVAEAGPAAGRPVLFFHGFGASRLCLSPDETLCDRLDARVIAVDRPGIGLSDPLPPRKVADWADDVRDLADELGLARFAVIGWSAGGSFALAAGAVLGERVTSLGIISGVAPGRGPEGFGGMRLPLRVAQWMSRVAPALTRLAFRQVERRLRRDWPGLLQSSTRWLPPADRELIAIPEIAETLRISALEAFRQGTVGMELDAAAQSREWGFRLADVTVPTRFWHGDSDTAVPPDAARHNARLVPRSSLSILPGEGHLLCFRRWPEILQHAIDGMPSRQVPAG